jgi:sialate O-acetylesterase
MKNNLFAFALLLSCPAVREAAQVRLPRLVSNGMVLQREQSVRIWGRAAPGEVVAVAFLTKTYHATAGPVCAGVGEEGNKVVV